MMVVPRGLLHRPPGTRKAWPGELCEPPSIILSNWKSNVSGDSLNLARAYPGVERGSPACVALDAFEKNCALNYFVI